jgi:hypothetical protein
MMEFANQQLENLASLEQDLATGKDKDGNDLKNLGPRLIPLLQNPAIS